MPRPRRKRLTRAQRYARSPRPPAAVELEYAARLGRVAERWIAKVRARLEGKIGTFALERRSDAASEEADAALDGLSFSTSTVLDASSGIAERVTRHSKAEFKRIGIRLRPGDEPGLSKIHTAWRKASAARVEKIFDREKDTIVELLKDSENRTPDELQDRLDERFEITKSKVQSAARDDILTLNGRITQERQTAAGVTEFDWTCAGDQKVRDSHRDMDGVRCSWDDPPEVDGEQVIPGEPQNCRCVAFPVLPELESEDEEDAA